MRQTDLRLNSSLKPSSAPCDLGRVIDLLCLRLHIYEVGRSHLAETAPKQSTGAAGLRRARHWATRSQWAAWFDLHSGPFEVGVVTGLYIIFL